MKFELKEYHRNISDKELIDDLKKVSEKLGKNSVTQEEYNKIGKYNSATYFRRFGNWFKALESANLEKTRTPMNIPEKELFENLEEVWIKLGRQPRVREIENPLSKFSGGTYENRFGGWGNALKSFVDWANKEEKSLEVEENKIKNIPKKHKTSRDINLRLRFVVMKRDNFKCKNCGRSPATDSKIILHIDHIKPYSKGGETVQENLQTLCSKCNIGKSNLSPTKDIG